MNSIPSWRTLLLSVLLAWGASALPPAENTSSGIRAPAARRPFEDPLAAPGTESRAAGRYVGQITFDGDPPKPVLREVDAAMRIECGHPFHGDRRLQVDIDGGVANVLVVLEPIEPAVPAPGTRGPRVLEKRGCRFEPRVLIVCPGEEVTWRIVSSPCRGFSFNSRHNGARNWNLPEGRCVTCIFPEIEIVKILCDNRPRDMTAYVAVLASPCAEVTDARGAFACEDVPAGLYTVRLWHERRGWSDPADESSVVIEAGQTIRGDRTLPSSWFSKPR